MNATNPFVFTSTASNHIPSTAHKLHICALSITGTVLTTIESWRTSTKLRIPLHIMYRNVSNFPFRLLFVFSNVSYQKTCAIDFDKAMLCV